MPGDTKIKQTPQGWIDIDNPTTFHPSRRLARLARRGTTATAPTTTSAPTRSAKIKPIDTQSLSSDGITLLSSLQMRLVDRLVNQQGVDLSDAMDVVTSNGYNKAASYGHMRSAGATHHEAQIVIDLDSPDVSVAYGRARANGYNHTGALQKALRDVDDD